MGYKALPVEGGCNVLCQAAQVLCFRAWGAANGLGGATGPRLEKLTADGGEHPVTLSWLARSSLHRRGGSPEEGSCRTAECARGCVLVTRSRLSPNHVSRKAAMDIAAPSLRADHAQGPGAAAAKREREPRP